MSKSSWKSVFRITCVLILQSAGAIPTAQVIYGADDRHDYYQEVDPAIQAQADSTVALVRLADLNPQGDITTINTIHYGPYYSLCAEEPYYDQEVAAFCSGFLVAPDTVVTAGHCISNQEDCNNTRFVFGFKISVTGQQPRSVATDHVFSCQSIVHTVVMNQGEDFAVVKLDRPVTFTQPLPYRRIGSVNVGDPLRVIGYPAGLPVKIAGGASVRSIQNQFLLANLDTYGGNSGSAVFNRQTGEIEGILVRGDADYSLAHQCYLSHRCTDTECTGEGVTLMKQVLPYLNP